MSVYKNIKYRAALLEIIENRKALPGKFTLRQLAEKAGLQASFLTNVLKGRFDFNADQLFAVATELDLNADERDYLLLLLEHERSVHKPRKNELLKEIQKRRQENLKSEKHLSVKVVEQTTESNIQYYLDPFVPVAMYHLMISPYDKQPERLAGVLGISESHLGEILKILLSSKLVVQEGGAYRVVAGEMTLPKRNPLCGPHLALMRLKSIDQLQRLSPDQAFSYSVTFTGTRETQDQLSDAYMVFLKKAQAIVKPAPSERVFQMSFDLFPWDLR